MATPNQIEANRRNAQKSTGPKTPEGKAAVSLNSLRHGLRARAVVLPREDPEEFQVLCEDLEAEWQPLTRTEHFYVEQMAVAYWKLKRLEATEAELLADRHAGTTPAMLDRLWQAQLRLERSFARAQHELERMQKSRRNQAPQPEEIAPARPAPQGATVPRPVSAVASAAAPLQAAQPQPPPPNPAGFSPAPSAPVAASARATP